MKTLFLYFSGTGNTKYAVTKLADLLEQNPSVYSIEEDIDFDSLIQTADRILIGYPIYGSDIPMIMRDFLRKHLDSFQYKQIMTLATQMMFSGDGGALACYFLKDANVKCIASMHINMPENIADFKLFKIKTDEESQSVFQKAERKIEMYAKKILSQKKIKTGRRFFSRPLGYLTQRAYFRPFHNSMQKAWKVNENTCITCGICVNNCPVHTLELIDGKIESKGECTLCYRCVNLCPTQSIKILGKHYPTKQYIKK